jgi:hypothetical protein
MGTLSRHRPPTDRLTLVQAICDLGAHSPALRDAVITDPFVGPEGAVILDVRIGQDTAYRVVAPTADEAYALLHELIHSMLDPAQGTRGIPAPTPSAACGREEARRSLPGAARPCTN